MCKKIQIGIIVACCMCIPTAEAEMVVTNGRNVISGKGPHQPSPLTSFFGGLGLIGIGLWINHKNGV